MHVCTECGHVSDEDMEFCPRCGSIKGANIDEEQMPPGFKVVSSPSGTIITRVDVRRIRLALMLALLPGIVDIFGLGHIVMGKYIRGIRDHMLCSFRLTLLVGDGYAVRVAKLFVIGDENELCVCGYCAVQTDFGLCLPRHCDGSQ